MTPAPASSAPLSTTTTPPAPAGFGARRRVVIVLFPGADVMDVAGPLQVFHEAGTFGTFYDISLVGTSPSVRIAQRLEISALQPLPEVGPGDRVMVPGYPLGQPGPTREMVRWLARAAAAGAETCGVCTGAFALGDAGLLDGRRCTTHWRRTKELQARFPRARVLPERLFVEDGSLVTSAGNAGGIDMSLALLERDCGPVLASAVARELVVYIRRQGSHAQTSVYLDYQTHLHPGVHQVQQYLVAHPESRSSLAELGRMVAMSERHLSRTFRRATGLSVRQYRERLRLERARDLLRNPRLTVDNVASACGFADARQLRRLWSSRFGAPPRAELARHEQQG